MQSDRDKCYAQIAVSLPMQILKLIWTHSFFISAPSKEFTPNNKNSRIRTSVLLITGSKDQRLYKQTQSLLSHESLVMVM